MSTKSNEPDYLAAAKKLETSWGGLNGGEEPHYQARALRNHICQVMNRGEFSSIPDGERVSGDKLGFMRQMICGLLEAMIDSSKAPRGGLASVLGIHQTRMADMLDRRIWPDQIEMSLPRVVLHSALWIMLGSNWRIEAKKVAVPAGSEWNLKDLFPGLRKGHPDWSTLWKCLYAQDIVDYFFPHPERELQPYFDIARRDWASPFDRHELGLIIRWTRRQVKATKLRGYIAFFVPTYATAEKLLDTKELVPEIAFAARETDLLPVDVFYPKIKDSETAMDPLIEIMNIAAEKEVQRHRRWGSSSSPFTGTDVTWRASDRVKALGPSLTSFLAFMFSSYVREERDGPKRHLHLYFIRPFCDSDQTRPFAMEGTDEEREMLISQASAMYPKFRSEVEPLLDDAKRLNSGF
jgi:hypothetical protein